MGRQTGVTKETVKRLVLDSGVIYKNWGSTDPTKPQTILGACRGGNVYNVEREWRDMEFDGVGGIIRGARRPVGVTVTLTANLVELNKDLIKMAIPGASYDPDGTAAQKVNRDGTMTPVANELHYSITSVLEAAIPEFEYYDIAIVAKYSGTTAPVICVVRNAMNNGGFEMSLSDKNEVTVTLNFEGTFDVENIDEEPWEIIVPEKIPEV